MSGPVLCLGDHKTVPCREAGPARPSWDNTPFSLSARFHCLWFRGCPGQGSWVGNGSVINEQSGKNFFVVLPCVCFRDTGSPLHPDTCQCSVPLWGPGCLLLRDASLLPFQQEQPGCLEHPICESPLPCVSPPL